MSTRICANCLEPAAARQPGAAGTQIAWLTHCEPCAVLVEGQMEVTIDRPDGADIQIWTCRRCDAVRACAPHALTRCHVCTDERTRISDAEQSRVVNYLSREPVLRDLVAAAFEMDASEVGAWELRAWNSVALPAFRINDVEQPGWHALATDLPGLPFMNLGRAPSHGTWARHEECGKVSRVGESGPVCPHCPASA